jgi:hypothetical protein
MWWSASGSERRPRGEHQDEQHGHMRLGIGLRVEGRSGSMEDRGPGGRLSRGHRPILLPRAGRGRESRRVRGALLHPTVLCRRAPGHVDYVQSPSTRSCHGCRRPAVTTYCSTRAVTMPLRLTCWQRRSIWLASRPTRTEVASWTAANSPVEGAHGMDTRRTAGQATPSA